MAVSTTGGGLYFDSRIDDSQFGAAIRRMNNDINKVTKDIESNGAKIDEWAKKASKAAAAYFSIDAVAGFIEKMVQVRGEFQQIEVAYTTMLGSKAKSNQLMAELVQLAATTPFTLQEVAKSGKQLLAYGFDVTTVTDTLTRLGDIAAGVSAPIGDIAYLFGTLKTQGRAFTKDIREFSGRGIPIIAELAKVLQTSEANVSKLVEAGKVGFPEVEKAFNNMTSSGGMFFNLMKEQSKTLTGQLSNLSDAWDNMLNSLGKSQEGLFSDAISGATELVQNYQQVLDIIQLITIAYGGYRAALIAYAVADAYATASVVTHGLAVRQLGFIETIVAVGKRVLIQLQTTYNAVLAASPIGATIALLTALGTVIYAVSQYTTAAEASQKRFNHIQEEGALAASKEVTNVTSLIDVIKSHTATNIQREAAYKKLQSTTNGVLAGFSQEEIAAGKATKSINEYIKSVREAATAKLAFGEFQKLNDEMAELDVKGSKAISIMDKAAMRAKALGTYTRLSAAGVSSTGRNVGISKEIVEQFNQARAIALADEDGEEALVKQQKVKLQQQIDALMKSRLGKQITDELTKDEKTPYTAPVSTAKNKAYYEEIVKKNTEDLEALDRGAKDFDSKAAPLIAKIKAARKALLSFDVSDKAGNAEDGAVKRQSEMLKKIYELNEKYNNKSLTDDEQKLADIRAEFKSLQKDIEIYNKDPKNKKVNANLKPQLEKALENQEFENETKRMATEIEKQKTLYSDFEAYKVMFGDAKAKERYGSELTSTDAYIADLEAKRAKLLETDPLNMTGIQKDRLKLYDDSINGLVESQKKGYDQLIQVNLSYLEERKVKTENYNAELAKLEGKPEEQAKLTATYKESLNTLDDANVQKLGSYKRLFDGVDRLSDENAKKVVNDAQVMLDALVKSGTISAELAKQIKDKLKETNTAIDQRLPANLNALANELRNLSGVVTGINADFAALLGTVSDVVKGVADIKTGLKDYKEAGEKDDTLGQITAGLGVLSAGVGIAGKVIGGVVGFFKGAKESAKKAAAELQAFQDNTVKGEIAYNQLLRERERTLKTIGDLSLSELRTQEALLKTQTSAAQADYNRLLALIKSSGQQVTGTHIEKKGGFLGIGKKSVTVQDTAGVAGLTYDQLEALFTQGKLTDSTKAWFTELQKAKSELDAIGVSGDDVLDAINQAATGTTASSIADAIISGFKEGKRSAADFADSFKDLMSEAALSVFKSNFLNKAIDGFYKQFASASENGLSEDDIKTLRDAYSKIITDGAAQLADFDKIIGTDSPTATKTGVSGAIVGEALTEGTANRGLGIWISQYDEIKRQGQAANAYYQMAANGFKLWVKIEENTFRTANNTDGLISKLDKIIENLGGDPGDDEDINQKLRNNGIKAA